MRIKQCATAVSCGSAHGYLCKVSLQRDVSALQNALPGMVDNAITTCDPEVIAELLARQDDFPKVWGRESIERRIQTVAGE